MPIRRSSYIRPVARLSDADYRSVLRFLHEAGDVEGADAFPMNVRRALTSLLRADNVWYWTIRDGKREFRWGYGACAVDDAFPAGILEQFDVDRHAREDPLQPVSRYMNVPVRRSDVRPLRAWRKTGIWASIDRPLGAKDWVRLTVASKDAAVARFELDNLRSDWDDRVIGLLQLLTPHLRQLIRRADARATVRHEARALTSRELEILSLVAEGRTNGELAHMLWISPNTVRKHLENAFDKLGVHTRTAAVARVFGRPV